MSKNISASIRQKLLNKARVENRLFSELLIYYAMERFLVRLSQTPYVNQFVLKGALLLRASGIGQNRPTRDIDLMGIHTKTSEELIEIFRACCLIPNEDGLFFDADTIISEEIRKEQNYKGIRISVRGALGSAIVLIQIDIGFGDVVTPDSIYIEYPVILDGVPPIIKGYPLETVIAEKYHAMIELDMANSRRKDFYDVWFICKSQYFSGKELGEAIQNTFKRRGLELPIIIPTALTSDFSTNKLKQQQWRAFLRKLGDEDTEVSLHVVIDLIRDFLWPLTESIQNGNAELMIWEPDMGWVK